jgi:hypothetical protein
MCEPTPVPTASSAGKVILAINITRQLYSEVLCGPGLEELASLISHKLMILFHGPGPHNTSLYGCRVMMLMASMTFPADDAVGTGVGSHMTTA